jgi:hypothetical protein
MYRTNTAMHRTPTSSADWSNERIDRLARALMPVIFGRPAHKPASQCDHRTQESKAELRQ